MGCGFNRGVPAKNIDGADITTNSIRE
jgi:hypothetical protein